jgi:hydroxymethylpyrimidine/phosphomethylpyrimidine kinase
MTGVPTVCLAIGSSDSSGGAGLQGDVKAFASVGCYAATVVVGVTAQTPDSLRARHSIPVDVIRAQLRLVLRELPVKAIKIGTTWSPDAVRCIAEELTRGGGCEIPVVVDPVMVMASGGRIPPADATASVVQHLLPLATIATPNRTEAAVLTGGGDPPPDRRTCAEQVVRSGARAVVVSPGEGESGDWFFDGREHRHIEGERLASLNDHGAGCAHSSVLAGLLAQGWSVPEAVNQAHERAAAGIRHGISTVGRHRHPVDLLVTGSRAVPRATLPGGGHGPVLTALAPSDGGSP